MSRGISLELISGDAAQAAEKIAEVAVISRPIRLMGKQANVWDQVKDFASKAWARDDVKATLAGAGIGAGIGGAAHMVGGGGIDSGLLGSVLTGGIAGGGVGYGASKLWPGVDGSPSPPPAMDDMVRDADGNYSFSYNGKDYTGLTDADVMAVMDKRTGELDPSSFLNETWNDHGDKTIAGAEGAVGGAVAANADKIVSKFKPRNNARNLRANIEEWFKTEAGQAIPTDDRAKIRNSLAAMGDAEVATVMSDIKKNKFVYGFDDNGKLISTGTQKIGPRRFLKTRPGVAGPVTWNSNNAQLNNLFPGNLPPQPAGPVINRKFLQDISKRKFKGRGRGLTAGAGLTGMALGIVTSVINGTALTPTQQAYYDLVRQGGA